jgi:hypothetical protein
MESAPYQLNPHPPKSFYKDEIAHLLSFPLGHFLHLRIFAPYVQYLDLELTKILIFNEKLILIQMYITM